MKAWRDGYQLVLFLDADDIGAPGSGVELVGEIEDRQANMYVPYFISFVQMVGLGFSFKGYNSYLQGGRGSLPHVALVYEGNDAIIEFNGVRLARFDMKKGVNSIFLPVFLNRLAKELDEAFRLYEYERFNGELPDVSDTVSLDFSPGDAFTWEVDMTEDELAWVKKELRELA